MSLIATYTLVGLGIYLLGLIIVTWHAARKESSADYIIGGRKVGFLGTMSSYVVSSWDGTGITIGFMFAAMFGFGFLWLVIGAGIASVIIAFQTQKICEHTEKGKYVTVSDMLKDRIGPKTDILSSWIIMLVTWFATAGQLYIAGKLMSAFIGVDSIWGIIITAAVIAAYMVVGGYMSVIRTDIFQWVAVILVTICAYAFGNYPSLPTITDQMFIKLDKQMLWGLLLFGILVGYSMPYLWQRLYSAKSAKIAKPAILSAALIILIIMFGAVIFVLTTLAKYPDLDKSAIIFALFTNPHTLPIVGPLLGVAVLALLMSSVDSYIYLATSTFVSNVLKIDHESNRPKFVKLSRIVIIVIFAILSLMAIFISDFVQYMVNTTSVLALLSPMLFISLYLKNKTKFFDWATVISFLIGFGVWIYMFMNGMFANMLMNIIPAIISSVISVAVLLLHNYKLRRHLSS